jgi:hypothetical protein
MEAANPFEILATLYQSKQFYCPNFNGGRRFILFQSFKSRYGLQPASDPVGKGGAVFFRVKQPARKPESSPSASAVFEKDCRYNSTPPYA